MSLNRTFRPDFVTKSDAEEGKKMLEYQKDMIRLLRKSGYGYRTIAYELGVHRSEVRDFCRMEGLTGDPVMVRQNMSEWYAQHGRCMVCGKPLSHKEHGRKRRFCSGQCRTKYWRGKHESEQD